MADSFNCPNCGQKLTAKPELAGQIISCPACGSQIQVPLFEIPVPMAQQLPSLPHGAIPMRLQNPYGQPTDGWQQPYPPQERTYPPQHSYGPQMADLPRRKPRSGMRTAFVVLAVIAGVSLAIAGGFVLVRQRAPAVQSGSNKGNPVSRDGARKPSVISPEATVRRVVNETLEANKRGDIAYQHWDSSLTASKLFAPTAWEIVNVDVYDDIATVKVRVDSSTQGGFRITKLWTYYLRNKTGAWKITLLSQND